MQKFIMRVSALVILALLISSGAQAQSAVEVVATKAAIQAAEAAIGYVADRAQQGADIGTYEVTQTATNSTFVASGALSDVQGNTINSQGANYGLVHAEQTIENSHLSATAIGAKASANTIDLHNYRGQTVRMTQNLRGAEVTASGMGSNAKVNHAH